MNFGSLFVGIGGIDLGLERAGMTCKWQVEIDPFCNKVLEKHWPNIRRFKDVRDVGKHNLEPVDLICGGFPCQPFSVAGKRKGKEDVRHLWPEMFRIIQELKPRWVLGENVAGILNMELENCFSDLEMEGYEVQELVIPACAVQAPHRRDRVWIVANRNRARCGTSTGNIDGNWQAIVKELEQSQLEYSRQDCHVADTCNERLQRSEWPRSHEQGQAAHGSTPERNHTWDEPWLEAATRLCGIFNGLSRELHIIGGLKDDTRCNKKSESERNFIIWKILRVMWEGRETAKASPELYLNQLYDSLPDLPCEGGSSPWFTQNQENEELYSLWKTFYSLPYKEAQQLQSELLEYLREKERRKKMGNKDRVNRLKALGNSVVPQIVEILGRAILTTERRP